MAQIQTGLEAFIKSPPSSVDGRRLGLLCNPASIDSHLVHASDLINSRFPKMLVALYAPQHGFMAEKQDNMIESRHISDPLSGLPVFSLYSDTRIPTREMLAPIDILIVDLQDVGTRVYTFIYTMSYCLEAAARFGKKIIILDRPNPVGGKLVEGNCIVPECTSFVGRYPMPMRHGLTMGELARLFNNTYGIGCDLEVISMSGWKRWMRFNDTGLPWIAPSPNLPTPQSATVYPGQVIWEGTNISEGRGTTLPFELFGAPFLKPRKIIEIIGEKEIPGAILRPAAFEPTSGKWQGELCHGFQIHVTDPEQYRPYETSLRLLGAIIKQHKNLFKWKKPPYEYEYERLPIDLIIGDSTIRQRIESLETISTIIPSWHKGLSDFMEISRAFHLYD
jgi:uncharacterized protein YbbC (DUF1343 family)